MGFRSRDHHHHHRISVILTARFGPVVVLCGGSSATVPRYSGMLLCSPGSIETHPDRPGTKQSPYRMLRDPIRSDPIKTPMLVLVRFVAIIIPRSLDRKLARSSSSRRKNRSALHASSWCQRRRRVSPEASFEQMSGKMARMSTTSPARWFAVGRREFFFFFFRYRGGRWILFIVYFLRVCISAFSDDVGMTCLSFQISRLLFRIDRETFCTSCTKKVVVHVQIVVQDSTRET